MTHETDPIDSNGPGLDADRQARKPSRGAGSGADPSPRDVRVGRLDTLPAIRNELGKLYRAARKVAGPTPTPSDATKLGWLLNALATSVVNVELAERVAALEENKR